LRKKYYLAPIATVAPLYHWNQWAYGRIFDLHWTSQKQETSQRGSLGAYCSKNHADLGLTEYYLSDSRWIWTGHVILVAKIFYLQKQLSQKK